MISPNLSLLVSLLFPCLSWCHSNLEIPPSWMSERLKGYGVQMGGDGYHNSVDVWFTNNTNVYPNEKDPGLDLQKYPNLRTYQNASLLDLLLYGYQDGAFEASGYHPNDWKTNLTPKQAAAFYNRSVANWTVSDVAKANYYLESMFPGKNFFQKQTPKQIFKKYFTTINATGIDDLKFQEVDPFTNNPWRQPGRAKVFSPCGSFGGNHHGCIGGAATNNLSLGERYVKDGKRYSYKACYNGGAEMGPFAEKVFTNPNVTIFSRKESDGIMEVGFSTAVNHGGGYQYRLCRINDDGSNRTKITSECFAQTPLEFVGNFSYLQYGSDPKNRTEIEAVRTNVGTFPPGSTWTKNPIPACAGPAGGQDQKLLGEWRYCDRVQFEPPRHAGKILGFAVGSLPYYILIDKVKIPEDLPDGRYILQLRQDHEQGGQVWGNCADVQITDLKVGEELKGKKVPTYYSQLTPLSDPCDKKDGHSHDADWVRPEFCTEQVGPANTGALWGG